MPNSFVLADDIGSKLGVALSSTDLWTSIAKTVIFILLGFFFTKKKLLPDNTGKILTKFIMTVCLPCLAFTSFMSDFTVSAGIDAVLNFVLGFVFYIGFIFLGKLLFLWVKDKKKRTVLAVLFAFGSTTFFGLPLASAIYGSAATIDFNIMNVAYRVFLYSYAYIAIANLKDEDQAAETLDATPKEKKSKTSTADMLKKIFLNPIVIATFAGLILWALGGIEAFQIVRTDWLSPKAGVSYEAAKKVAFWRFDVTLPWIHQTFKTLGNLSSTVILFAIGCTLGGTNIKDAARDKYAWAWAIIKVLVAPSIVLVFLVCMQLIANASGWLVNSKDALAVGVSESARNVSQLVSVNTLASCIITWMVPPATVAVGYCINFDQEKEMASHISLIGTFVSVIGIVIWVLIITVLNNTGLFYDPSWFVAVK